MKQSIFIFAVSFCLSAEAQQTASLPTNDLPKYSSVNYGALKKFKTVNTSYSVNNYNQSQSFSLVQPEMQSYNFQPLHQYLKEDMNQFRVDKNKEAWTQFTSGMLSSYQQKKWFENKNYVQQRWMAQKVKGK